MIVKDMMPRSICTSRCSSRTPLPSWTAIGADAWKLAGGNDSLDWFKDRIMRPKAVIDMTGIPELKGIEKRQTGSRSAR